MHSYAQPTAPVLAEIAAAQQAGHIFAFDRLSATHSLARLQSLYARRRAQLDALGALFDEGTPDLTLRGEVQHLTLRGELVADVYGVLRDNLDKALLQLEKEIVQAHQQVAQWAADVASGYEGRTDYVPHILALCAPGGPALPASLPSAGSVWLARADAAEALEEALQQEHGVLGAYGREILWHPLFPVEYVTCVSKLPLYEVAEFHEALPGWCNQRRPLDAHDLGYLADVLHEALADQPTDLATLRLRRALTWVEQAHPAPTPAAATPQKEGAARE